MKLKTKKLDANIARRIVASLMAGSLVFYMGSFAFAADANGNNKTVTGETASKNITGGDTNSGDANYNTLTVINTDANDKEILGGNTTGSTGNASNNTVFLRNVRNISYVDGGIAAESRGNSNYNTVYIWNSDLVNVHGGHTGYGSANYNKVYFYSGTVSKVTGAGIVTKDGEASFNELYIYGGTLNDLTQGGYTYPEANGRTNNNLVEVYGGTINGQIMGGYVSANGQANNNKVNIYGGKINGDILGGHVGSGEVKNNTINIYGGDISNANIYAAQVGSSYTSQPGWGNSINFYTKGITAKQIGGFDNIGFYLPNDIHNGDNVLTLTGGATDWNQSRIKVSTLNSYLNPGDTISLVKNSNGLNLNIDEIRTASAQLNGRNIVSHGTAWDNYVDYNLSNGNELTATIYERTTDGLKEQISALPVSVSSVRGMIDSGTNRILNWLPPEEVESKGIDHSTPFEAFMGASIESVTIDTGNGSKLRNKSGGQNIGVARALKNRHGIFLFAPITDYGTASYDTTLENGLRGGGNSKYFTAGLIARQWNNNGMYYEASFRAGQMRTTFTSDKFTVGDEITHASYSSHTPVYTGHVRIGWRGKVSPQNILDVYGVYSHNHIGSIDANLRASGMDQSQEYKIGSSNSKTIRIGARLTRQVNERSRFYSGLLYQYQFSDNVTASYMDVSTPKFGAKGSSGMIELGWQLKPSQNSAVMLDSALVGWVGKQKGLSFQIKLKKDF